LEARILKLRTPSPMQSDVVRIEVTFVTAMVSHHTAP